MDEAHAQSLTLLCDLCGKAREVRSSDADLGALEALPEVSHAEISGQRNAPGSPTTTFTLTTTFKAGAVKPAATAAP
jgi:hypothetical protein